jgi:hypothetical protein
VFQSLQLIQYFVDKPVFLMAHNKNIFNDIFRRELPDYYEIIKKPVDITKILKNVDDGKVEHHFFVFLNQNLKVVSPQTSLNRLTMYESIFL